MTSNGLELSTQEVAIIIGRTDRQVRNLVKMKLLSARVDGRGYRISRESLARYRRLRAVLKEPTLPRPNPAESEFEQVIRIRWRKGVAVNAHEKLAKIIFAVWARAESGSKDFAFARDITEVEANWNYQFNGSNRAPSVFRGSKNSDMI